MEEDKLTRDQKRSRRKREIRSISYAARYEKKIKTKPKLVVLNDRPKVRGDCVGGSRPCPFVSCKYHLYLDVTPAGSVKINFPDLEVWEMKQTCALDVADEQNPLELEKLGELMNLTREGIRQLLHRAEAKIQGCF